MNSLSRMVPPVKRLLPLASLLCAALFWAAPSHAARYLFLTPELSVKGGYTSNRYLDSAEEGSGYGTLAPGLTLNWFDAGSVEGFAGVRFERTEYLEEEAQSSHRWVYEAGVLQDLTAFSWALGMNGGRFEDEALPDEDADWIALTPSLVWLADPSLSLGLDLLLQRTRYPSRETPTGETQTNDTFQAAPSLRWSPSRSTSLWTRLFAYRTDSNIRGEDVTGFEVRAGVAFDLSPSASIGLWGGVGRAEYEKYDAHTAAREDDLGSAGGWLTYRLAPWAELHLEGNYLTQDSTLATKTYDTWDVGLRLRLLYDWMVWEGRGNRAP